MPLDLDFCSIRELYWGKGKCTGYQVHLLLAEPSNKAGRLNSLLRIRLIFYSSWQPCSHFSADQPYLSGSRTVAFLRNTELGWFPNLDLIPTRSVSSSSVTCFVCHSVIEIRADRTRFPSPSTERPGSFLKTKIATTLGGTRTSDVQESYEGDHWLVPEVIPTRGSTMTEP